MRRSASAGILTITGDGALLGGFEAEAIPRTIEVTIPAGVSQVSIRLNSETHLGVAFADAYFTMSEPSAPRSLVATPGDRQVALSWTEPSSGSSTVTRYEVSSNGGTTWVTASSNTRHTFTGLTNGTTYNFRVRAVNAVGAGPAASATATPQNDPIESFVARLYRLILEREPDAAGLNNWATQLRNRAATGAEVAQGFVFSAEMNGKNLTNAGFVDILYRAFLGREPDAGGRNNWIVVLTNGGWSRTDVFYGFADSVEFGNICAQYGIRR